MITTTLITSDTWSSYTTPILGYSQDRVKEHYPCTTSTTSPAGDPFTLRIAYVTTGTEKKFRFRAYKPADLAEFLDILFLPRDSIKARVEEIIRNNERNNAPTA